MKSLGARIFELRKSRKISQGQLGIAIGASQATISQYEYDQVDIPFSAIKKIAAEFQMPLSVFFSEVAPSEAKPALDSEVNFVNEAILRSRLPRERKEALSALVLIPEARWKTIFPTLSKLIAAPTKK